ncbi:hypothetical protein EBU71_01135 [bacterium]|nr:hypothetical protein [Candidatus Elulimicrobium humile]
MNQKKDYNSFKTSIKEIANIHTSFIHNGKRVVIDNEFNVSIDNEKLNENFSSSEEAISYTRSYIDNIVNTINTKNIIPDERLIAIIQKYHNTNKITDTLLESYKNLASSEVYTIDSVITELKQKENSTLYDKLEYVLEDNTRIALTTETQEMLAEVLKDKPDTVLFMSKNKTNFMSVVRGII